MAIPTPADIQALDFGYLTGEDILLFCPMQLLIRQNTIDINFLTNCVNIAYSEMYSNLATKFDIKTEFAKIGTTRDMTCVKITAIKAIKNAIANLPAIPVHLMDLIKNNEQNLLDIRNGQLSLIGLKQTETPCTSSNSILVKDKFWTIG